MEIQRKRLFLRAPETNVSMATVSTGGFSEAFLWNSHSRDVRWTIGVLKKSRRGLTGGTTARIHLPRRTAYVIILAWIVDVLVPLVLRENIAVIEQHGVVILRVQLPLGRGQWVHARSEPRRAPARDVSNARASVFKSTPEHSLASALLLRCG